MLQRSGAGGAAASAGALSGDALRPGKRRAVPTNGSSVAGRLGLEAVL